MIFKALFVISTFMLSAIVTFAQKPHIIIDKSSLELYVIDNQDTIFVAPICAGKNLGNKERVGDCKTPEGEFMISQIQNSSNWKHDFNDGKGVVKGAYGPWFFRLKTPEWTTIGIHGTCFPNSISCRESEGCIRMKNSDIQTLRKYVYVGMNVLILPDKTPSCSAEILNQKITSLLCL
jgi:lipoprotein-anchoring transpeptidase ErfK/SrfK